MTHNCPYPLSETSWPFHCNSQSCSSWRPDPPRQRMSPQSPRREWTMFLAPCSWTATWAPCPTTGTCSILSRMIRGDAISSQESKTLDTELIIIILLIMRNWTAFKTSFWEKLRSDLGQRNVNNKTRWWLQKRGKDQWQHLDNNRNKETKFWRISNNMAAAATYIQFPIDQFSVCVSWSTYFSRLGW